MEEILETSAKSEIQEPTENSSTEEQTQQQVAPATNESDKAKKELEAAYTRTRQGLIDSTIKLVQKDPEELIHIRDIKLQNKVIKEIYGLDNLAEVKEVYGENFYKKEEEVEVDEMTKLKRDVAIMKSVNEREKLEREIADFKKLNPSLFVSQDAEDELRERLSLLSPTVSIAQRVEMAAKLAFGNTDPVKDAYKEMKIADTPIKENSMANLKEDPKKSQSDQIRKLLDMSKRLVT